MRACHREEPALPGAHEAANLAQLAEFDEIIDVRTPAEFAEDRVPGAVNRPVLSDQERAHVGTLYNQVSAFTGRKVGAALVSRNIAQHIETSFSQKPKGWRPLIYCWRGGKRSAAMVHILREIGWDAHRLEGGYKAYRRTVAAELPQLAQRFRFRVVCGLTGSGKSRLLGALHAAGGQVLDLESFAAHRGSVLGSLPGEPQPTQKMFESRIWWQLRALETKRPVFVESESKRIGTLHVPEALMAAIWQSDCVQVRTPVTVRVGLLKEEYAHFLADPAALGTLLDRLISLHGREQIEHWKTMAHNAQWDVFVQELLERHYDPAYTRAIVAHYPGLERARTVEIASSCDESFAKAARALMEDSIGVEANPIPTLPSA
jgi:tRNA 2-selenouridine synthase